MLDRAGRRSIFVILGSFFAFKFGILDVPSLGWAQASYYACILGGLSAFLSIAQDTLSIRSKREDTLSVDNSPQARFARDQMSQLEMEQEVDRQLALGQSGMEQMNLAKGVKEIPIEEWEEKYEFRRSMTRKHDYEKSCGCILCDEKEKFYAPYTPPKRLSPIRKHPSPISGY